MFSFLTLCQGLGMRDSGLMFRVYGTRVCRFNDEATPAGQFVLRLCAEAEARSLEDLKKACKDSKVAPLLGLLLLLPVGLLLLLLPALVLLMLLVEGGLSSISWYSGDGLRNGSGEFR